LLAFGAIAAKTSYIFIKKGTEQYSFCLFEALSLAIAFGAYANGGATA
jgi:hypothetical protein